MKITSRRGRIPAPEATELEVEVHHFGIIIVDAPGMTPEEIERAQKALRELREQLDKLRDVINTGWFNLPKFQRAQVLTS